MFILLRNPTATSVRPVSDAAGYQADIRLSKTPVVMELLDLGNQESVQQTVV
jgi:hypothetical protein